MHPLPLIAISGSAFEYTNQILIFVVYAVSLNLLLGYAGQLSVAHAAFGAVGGYTAAYLSTAHGSPFLLTVLIGVVGAALLGVVVSLPALYLDQQFLILLTLAVSTVVIALTGAIPALGGTFGLTNIEAPTIFGFTFATPQRFTILLGICAAITIAVCLRLGDSPFGRVLRAIRDDELVTRSLGRSAVTYKVMVFGISCGFAGLAGALFAYYNSTAQPLGYDLNQSILIIAMVVVGGTANLWGSVAGACLLVLLQPLLESLVSMAPERAALLRLMIYGLTIVVVLRFRPRGLIPEGFSPFAWMVRRSSAPDTPPAAARGGEAELATLNPRSVDRDAAEPVLRVQGLTKSFGGITAAADLNIEVRAGEVAALIGPNGAGKTTVFNLLTGRIAPDAGQVYLGGRSVVGWSPERIARAGMVRSFQDVRVYPRLTVLENVMLGVQGNAAEGIFATLVGYRRSKAAESTARARALEQLQFVGLAHRRDELAGQLAFGEQKLVALARIVASGAEVLLLDEPASGIDVEWVDKMLELIDRLRANGHAICIVEHNLHVIEKLADHAYFMETGRITAEGSMAELVAQDHLAEAYFGRV